MEITQTPRQRQELNRLKAISQPERAKILLILGERTASPVQIARELGGDVREVSRHCRMLQKLECVELVSTRPRRGATEHFYRAIEFHLVEDDEWDSLHPVQQEHFLGDVVSAIARDIDRSHQAKMLGSDPDSEELTRTPRIYDRQGQAKAIEVMKRAREELTEAAEESADRLAESGEDGVAHTTFLGFFEIPQA